MRPYVAFLLAALGLFALWAGVHGDAYGLFDELFGTDLSGGSGGPTTEISGAANRAQIADLPAGTRRKLQNRFHPENPESDAQPAPKIVKVSAGSGSSATATTPGIGEFGTGALGGVDTLTGAGLL